jgi:hypothetical protein
MSNRSPSQSESWRALLVLALFIGVMALWDWTRISFLTDSILPPTLTPGRDWELLGDWSAAHAYDDNWQVATVRLLDRLLPDPALLAVIVLLIHALLWGGVFFAARALWTGSPWIAVLAVFLVRIMPDLFSVQLLSLDAPSRAMAVALAFWSVGLTIQRRWIAACLVAGILAHFSPSIAFWFAQFLIVIVFALNYEWGWQRSFVGSMPFLLVAGGPLVRFLIAEIAPDPPIPPDAMLGLHFFANPALSPFATPLAANACMVVYLAMAFTHLKHYFNRQTAPVIVVMFLIGFAGYVLEIAFIGLVPVERAARFEIHNLRGFWLLWMAIFHAPDLAERIRVAWQGRLLARAVGRVLLFSLPVAWSAFTLIERLVAPPRWNAAVALAMLALVLLTAFVLPHESLPIDGAYFALAIAARLIPAAAIAWPVRRDVRLARAAKALLVGAAGLATLIAVLHGAATLRAVADARQAARDYPRWEDSVAWIRAHTPPGALWAVRERPRAFRRATGRPILVNRHEIPRDPDSRYEWFQIYIETHHWVGGPDIEYADSANPEAFVQKLRLYRRSFADGISAQVRSFRDWLAISRVLVLTYPVDFALLRESDLPYPRRSDATVPWRIIHAQGPYRIVQLHE